MKIMRISLKLRICLHIILWLCFQRVLQDAAGFDPSSQRTDSSVSDANFMFEFLLGGVEINQDNNIVLLDKEMASMRPGRAFLAQINDSFPRSLSPMVQMVDTLKSQRRRPMTQTQFDSLVLSLAYSAHQAWHQDTKEKQEDWGGVLLQLVNITAHELRGNYLFSYA